MIQFLRFLNTWNYFFIKKEPSDLVPLAWVASLAIFVACAFWAGVIFAAIGAGLLLFVWVAPPLPDCEISTMIMLRLF